MTSYEDTRSGDTQRVTVVRGPVGWEIREEREGQLVRTSRYSDWHRVERALALRARSLGTQDEGRRT